MDDDGWVTIKGTHVQIKNGVAQTGPLKGMTFSKAKSSSKSEGEYGAAPGKTRYAANKSATKENVEELVKGKSNAEALKALKKKGYIVEDRSEEAKESHAGESESDRKHVFDVRIYNRKDKDAGYVRVYRPRRQAGQKWKDVELKVQQFTKTEIKPSNIPVFMPGGKDTFNQYF